MEILVLVLASVFSLTIIMIDVIHKIKKKPSLGSDCDCCQGGGNLVKAYRNLKKKEEKICLCNKEELKKPLK